MWFDHLLIQSNIVLLAVAGEILGVEANRKSRRAATGPEWLPLRFLTSIEQLHTLHYPSVFEGTPCFYKG